MSECEQGVGRGFSSTELKGGGTQGKETVLGYQKRASDPPNPPHTPIRPQKRKVNASESITLRKKPSGSLASPSPS